MSLFKSLFVLSLACLVISCKPDAPNSITTQTDIGKVEQTAKPAKSVVSSAGNIDIVNDETNSIRPNVNKKNVTSSNTAAATASTNAPNKPPMTKKAYTPQQLEKIRAQKEKANNKSGKTAAERLAETKALKGKTDNNPLTPSKPGPPIPNSCELLSEAFIAKVVNVDPGYIAVKDGSGKSGTQKSCFFRWEHEGTPNSGVLVQVQTNPVPDDFPEWAKYYISAKKKDGDKAPDGSATFIYKDFPGFGQDGAYSFGLGRYYWRTADDYLCMIAFNLESNEAQQLAWAKELAAEVVRNFKS